MKKSLFFLLLSTLLYSQNINFTWIQGTNQTEQTAEIGLYGLDSDENWPGIQRDMSYVVDKDGLFWMFGGYSEGSYSSILWSYNKQNNNFTFKKGRPYNDSDGFDKGINVESYRNMPSGVSLSSFWTSNNNLYKFGGITSSLTASNDFWKFNIATNNWIKISEPTNDGAGHFGTKGVEDIANIPPALINTTTWTDEQGNLYLFGGRTGLSNRSNTVEYDTLWKYNISTKMWSWIGGSDQPNATGNYNTLGQEHSLNSPGARYGSCSFKDSQGNIYIYGGFFNGKSQYYLLNDLWKLNMNTGQWTWLKGSLTSKESIVSDIGVEDPNNLPNTLDWSLDNPKPNHWVDNSGDFWIFVNQYMWRYRISTNSWAVMKQKKIITDDDKKPIYGTINVEDPKNFPGTINGSACWIGNDGNLYQFKGSKNIDAIWKYNIQTNNWVWIKGVDSNINSVNKNTYQKLAGLLESENTPGGTLDFGAKWTDEDGNLWLYGVLGSFHKGFSLYVYRSDDLWKFDISQKKWQWINGNYFSFYNFSNYNSLDYGVLNVEDKRNSPGSRNEAFSWIDKNGNLWLFGGNYGSFDNQLHQDLWMYNRKTNNWVWKGGKQKNDEPFANYGTLGVSSITNIPGARRDGKSWVDQEGNFYLYGGYGFDEKSSQRGYLNDVWKYDITLNQWVWLSGDKIINSTNSKDYPIAKEESGIGWQDENKNFWYYFSGIMWKYQTNNNTWTKVRSSIPFTALNYGNIGVENDTNFPGNRANAFTWTGKNGDLWFLGGKDSYSKLDLWRYNINTNNWTWMYGPKSSLPKNYGQINVSSPTNLPPHRYNSATWNDQLGNLYFFGGDLYNDVWRINFNNYAPNLFTVTAQDETCDTKNNGAILITSKENYTYSYSLNGSNWVSFNSSVTLNNLNGGTYNLCIKLSNDTQYCYVVNIGKPENLKGKIELSGRLAKVQIQSGTAPFTITYGKKNITVYSKGSYDLILDNFADNIVLESSKSCEGKIIKELITTQNDIVIFPNPTSDLINIVNHLNEKVHLALYSQNGQLIMEDDIKENHSKTISIKKQPSGTYLLVLESENRKMTKKIIKQ